MPENAPQPEPHESETTEERQTHGEHHKHTTHRPDASAQNTVADSEAYDGVIEPSGTLAVKTFSWTLALVVFAVARLLAISWPPDGTDGFFVSLRAAIRTAQQVVGHISLTDLPALVGATFASEPVLSLLLVTAASIALCLTSLPSILLGDDRLTWRAVAMLVVLLVSALGAIAVAPLAWRPLVIVVLGVYAWALVSWWGRGAQVARWAKYAERMLESRDSAGHPADWTTNVTLSTSNAPQTFRQLASALATRAVFVRRAIERRRGRAFRDPAVLDAYAEAFGIRRALATEARARRRGRTASTRVMSARTAVAHGVLVVRKFVLTNGVVLGGVLLVAMLSFSPRPWIAPTCQTTDDGRETVYVLSTSPPTVLLETTRTVEVRTDWDGVELAAGACRES